MGSNENPFSGDNNPYKAPQEGHQDFSDRTGNQNRGGWGKFLMGIGAVTAGAGAWLMAGGIRQHMAGNLQTGMVHMVVGIGLLSIGGMTVVIGKVVDNMSKR